MNEDLCSRLITEHHGDQANQQAPAQDHNAKVVSLRLKPAKEEEDPAEMRCVAVDNNPEVASSLLAPLEAITEAFAIVGKMVLGAFRERKNT